MPVRLDASSIPRHAIAVAINAALIRPDVFVVSFNVIVYRSGLTKGTGVLSGARRIDVTMSITRIPL